MKAQPLRFRLISAVGVLAGLYHVAALSIPAFARWAYPATYPLERHVVFILINLAAAWLFLKRPRWFIWVFLALTAQIVFSHGGHAWRNRTQWNGTEWVDITVIMLALMSLGALYADRSAQDKK